MTTHTTTTTTTPTRPSTPAQEKLFAELREQLAAAPLPAVLHVVEVARQLAANYAATGHIDGAPAKE